MTTTEHGIQPKPNNTENVTITPGQAESYPDVAWKLDGSHDDLPVIQAEMPTSPFDEPTVRIKGPVIEAIADAVLQNAAAVDKPTVTPPVKRTVFIDETGQPEANTDLIVSSPRKGRRSAKSISDNSTTPKTRRHRRGLWATGTGVTIVAIGVAAFLHGSSSAESNVANTTSTAPSTPSTAPATQEAIDDNPADDPLLDGPIVIAAQDPSTLTGDTLIGTAKIINIGELKRYARDVIDNNTVNLAQYADTTNPSFVTDLKNGITSGWTTGGVNEKMHYDPSAPASDEPTLVFNPTYSTNPADYVVTVDPSDPTGKNRILTISNYHETSTRMYVAPKNGTLAPVTETVVEKDATTGNTTLTKRFKLIAQPNGQYHAVLTSSN